MKMKPHKHVSRALSLLMALILFVFVQALCAKQTNTAKFDSVVFLSSFAETIEQKVKMKYNYASDLKAIIESHGDINTAAETITQKPEVVFSMIVEDETVKSIFPKGHGEEYIGANIKSLNYAYTLALLRNEFVFEGPVLQEKEFVFLGIQPFSVSNPATHSAEYSGEIVVALNAEYIIEQCNLQKLEDGGFDYELWRVNPADGRKQIIKTSSSTVDFSEATERKIITPTVWTLSIIPKGGWRDIGLTTWLIIAGALSELVFCFMLKLYSNKKEIQTTLDIIGTIDPETGLYRRDAFEDIIAPWAKSPYAVICITIENYTRITQLASLLQKQEILAHIIECLQSYVKCEHVTARIGECGYIIAVKDELTATELDNLEKGLSIELLQKVTIDGEKEFISAKCSGARAPESIPPKDLVNSVIVQHYKSML